MPSPEKKTIALNCALKTLELSNGNSALYKLPNDGFEFFSGVYIPCLLGLMSWRKTVPNIKKLVVFLREAEKWGVYFGTFDDIPAIQDDSDVFLLFYAVYVLKEHEAAKTPDRSRNERLKKIERAFMSVTERIFNGFRKDKDPSRAKKGRKPTRMPEDYEALYQLIKAYFNGKSKPEPSRPRPTRPVQPEPEPEKPEKPEKPNFDRTPDSTVLTIRPSKKRIGILAVFLFIPILSYFAIIAFVILGIKYLIYCRAASYIITKQTICISRKNTHETTIMAKDVFGAYVTQSPLQKIFGVGDIAFMTSRTGAPILLLREIKDPEAVLSMIQSMCGIQSY